MLAPDLSPGSLPSPMRFSQLTGVRITARPDAIDRASWPDAAIVVRIAPDDVLVIDATLDDAAQVSSDDPFAIVESETMFHGAWLDAAQLAALRHKLEWQLADERPSLAQGMACGLAVKVVQLAERTLLIVSGSALHEVPERLGACA